MGNSWRTTGDISPSFTSMLGIFHANVRLNSYAAAAAVGKAAATRYGLADLWSGAKSSTTGEISASVPAHAVVMYRLSAG